MTAALLLILLPLQPVAGPDDPAPEPVEVTGEGDFARVRGRAQPLFAYLDALARQSRLELALERPLGRSDLEAVLLAADLPLAPLAEAVEIVCGAAGLAGEVTERQIRVSRWPAEGNADVLLERALDCHRRSLFQDPDHPEAPLSYEAMGEIGLLLGRRLEGLRALETLVQNFPHHPATPVVLLRLGEAYEEAAQPDGAMNALSRLVNQFPTAPQTPEALLRMAELHGRMGQDTEERRGLLLVAESHADAPAGRAALLRLAREALLGGDAARALRWLATPPPAGEPEPRRRHAFLKGVALSRLGRFAEAEREAQDFLEQTRERPEGGYALRLLGRASEGLGESAAAIVAWWGAARRLPSAAERLGAAEAAARLSVAEGLPSPRDPALLELLERIGGDGPLAPALRLRVAAILRQAGRPARALHELRQVKGDAALERAARVEEMECALSIGALREVVAAAKGLRFAGREEEELRRRAAAALGDAWLRLGKPEAALSAYLGEPFDDGDGEATR